MQQNNVHQLRRITHPANCIPEGAMQIAHPRVNQGRPLISDEKLIECDPVLRLPRSNPVNTSNDLVSSRAHSVTFLERQSAQVEISGSRSPTRLPRKLSS